MDSLRGDLLALGEGLTPANQGGPCRSAPAA
jgi:hypothetical protein